MTLIIEILRGTPLWAWVILASLVILGVRRLRKRFVTPWTALIAPAAFLVVGAVSSARSGLVLAVWAVVVVISFALGQATMADRTATVDVRTNKLIIAGSWRPLAWMVGIFGINYVIAVMKAIEPLRAIDPVWQFGPPVVLGALTGLFAAQTWSLYRMSHGSLRPLAVTAVVVASSTFALQSPVSEPVTLSACATPRQINDGFSVAAPSTAGIDDARLCGLIKQAAAANLNLHSIVVERGGAIIAEQYLPGVDWSIWSLRGYAQNFGPDEQHDMRSVSKSVVGLLVGIAIAQGKMKGVDTPVFDSYPGLAEFATPPKRAIKLHHVLNMSTGLAWHETAATYGTFANDETRLFLDWRIPRVVLKRELLAAPGELYNYNGGNTALLADLLEQQTGETLANFARKHLFEPLGIQQWTWVRDPWRRNISFAGLRLRPRDMLKIGRVLRERGAWQGKQIIPSDWIERSMRGYAKTANGLGYGYQWYSGVVVNRGANVSWYGAMGNGGQRLFVVPDLELTIAMTAGGYNSSSIGKAQMGLFREIVASVK